MLESVDHVGYLARDVDAVARSFVELLGIEVIRSFDRPEFDLFGVYLGAGWPSIEVFSFSEPELLDQRLRNSNLLLDHVAYAVPDIEAVAESMRQAGVRFCGPDFRMELQEPVELSGVLHLWTVPETCAGQSIQLVER